MAEYPLMCSFPQHEKAPRLFLAETVAVAIEVKSNLQAQWSEVLRTARQVKRLRRQFKRDAKLADAAHLASVAGNHEPKHAAQLREISRGMEAEANALPSGPGENIPLYVVGYFGWKNAQALEKKLVGAMDGDVRLVDGVFQLDIQPGGPVTRLSYHWNGPVFPERKLDSKPLDAPLGFEIGFRIPGAFDIPA